MKKTLFAFITLVALCLIGCEEKRPPSPTGFTAKQVGNTIELTWNRVYEANEYRIENTSTGTIKYISSTSYIDEYPKEGMNNYELQACGTTSWSGTVYASCYFEKNASGGGSGGGEGESTLPAPTGFTLSQTSEYVKLSWNKVSGATSYYALWYYPEEQKWYILDETTSTSYKDYEVTAGTTYIYGVTALDANGSNGEIAYGEITFNGSGSGGGGGGGTSSKPSTPTGVTATAYSSYIAVSWNSASGATSYYVYRSTSASGSYSYLANTYDTYYTDYDAYAGTTYYYKVSAVNSAGESSMSSYASAKISSSGGGGGGDNPGGGGGTVTKPSAPTGVKATQQGDEIKVTWNSVSNAVKYYIYRSESSYGTYSLMNESYTNSYTDSYALISGKTYYYKVSAVNSGGESSKSSSAYCKYERQYAPCAPQGVSVTKGYSSLTIKWNINTSDGCGKPTSQKIYFYNPSTSSWDQKTVQTTSNSGSYNLTSTYLNQYTISGYMVMFIISLENSNGKAQWEFEYNLDEERITHYEEVY